jgi:hypothetical protein
MTDLRFHHHDPALLASLMPHLPALPVTRRKKQRRPLTFRERDGSRAIRAAMKSHQRIVGISIGTDGTINIKTGEAEQVSVTPANEWDTVK